MTYRYSRELIFDIARIVAGSTLALAASCAMAATPSNVPANGTSVNGIVAPMFLKDIRAKKGGKAVNMKERHGAAAVNGIVAPMFLKDVRSKKGPKAAQIKESGSAAGANAIVAPMFLKGMRR